MYLPPSRSHAPFAQYQGQSKTRGDAAERQSAIGMVIDLAGCSFDASLRPVPGRKQTLAPPNAGTRMNDCLRKIRCSECFGAEVPAYFAFRFFSCLAAFFSFIVLAGFFFSDFFESIPLLMSLPRSWS